MYIDTSSIQRKGKIYTRHLLRESFREGGKVRHRTIANLSSCSQGEIQAIRLALRHKHDLTQVGVAREFIQVKQGLSMGAVWLVFDIARRLGIADALGTDRQGRLALWQVIARVIDQGSRLSAVRLAGSHAACDVLGLERFNEDDLYENLDWLNDNQAKIEDRLYQKKKELSGIHLFLYDVTSSYFEGEKNELAAFGYNRDGKRGKRQIVIGLLCNDNGQPLSIEVFSGNTQDPKTVASQVEKVAKRFGGGDVTFVGDRGMIKSHQIGILGDHNFHYITAITKPQIEAMLKNGVFQMSLFDEVLAEIETSEGVRYILRRNPVRAEEIAASRTGKIKSLQDFMDGQNQYLKDHLRSKAAVAVRKVESLCKKSNIDDWIKIIIKERSISMETDSNKLDEISKLDGCYALKTDLEKQVATKEVVHDRYKDLALVEQAFRDSKTVHLEMRPINVRKESRTRGHAFVVMLAYEIIRELALLWRPVDLTVEEGIGQLSTLCMTEVTIKDEVRYNQIPVPRESIEKLLNIAGVQLPQVLPSRGIIVTTKKKLLDRRI
jgi:transposase